MILSDRPHLPLEIARSILFEKFGCEGTLSPLPSERDQNFRVTGPDARGPARLIIDQQPDRWVVRQIFDDPAGDHDWGISAEVDLAASDEAGTAVVHVTAVDRL